MRQITLGSTGIMVPQNAFGALPIQRVDMDTAVHILRRAFEGGILFYDTAHGYTDSEEKLGKAFRDVREKIYLATKSPAKTPEQLKQDLDTSLERLQTDYIDIFQFHNAKQVYRPGDGTGMYETMLALKESGKIRHIGMTAHKIGIGEEAIDSGLYETLQFPFSYLSSDREQALAARAKKAGMGLIAMKGLAGGLINNSRAAMAFMLQFDNVLPIWGIQRESELEEWLSYMEQEPAMDQEIAGFIQKERKELNGQFCRGCGYCMPCPAGIEINTCARMSLLLRRSPSARYLEPEWQEKMHRIDACLHCGACMKKCPYELNTPELLKSNLEDYDRVVAGEISIK